MADSSDIPGSEVAVKKGGAGLSSAGAAPPLSKSSMPGVEGGSVPGSSIDGPKGSDIDLVKAAAEQARARGRGSMGALSMPPEDTFPGYQLVREIHRGGQGIVYQALHKGTRRKVAIKVMKEGPFVSAKERVRFEREVDVLSALNHPNIVAVRDSGEVNGMSFF